MNFLVNPLVNKHKILFQKSLSVHFDEDNISNYLLSLHLTTPLLIFWSMNPLNSQTKTVQEERDRWRSDFGILYVLEIPT